MMFLLFESILLIVHWFKDLLYGFFLGAMSHVIAFDVVFTQQVLVSHASVVPVLSSPVKIYDDEFFNHMFDLELLKFRVDLERIYGQQPLEPINVKTTFGNVFNNLQNCPIIINVVDPRAILSLVVDVVVATSIPKIFLFEPFSPLLIYIYSFLSYPFLSFFL